MPRLALINFLIGFTAILIAACGGAFVSLNLTSDYLMGPELVNRWQAILERSAHGHTNLFGMLHICFGLTLPYSKLSLRIKGLQTIGLASGLIAMAIGLLIKAATAPSLEYQWIDIAIGSLLTLSLLAILSHVYGLGLKLFRN